MRIFQIKINPALSSILSKQSKCISRETLDNWGFCMASYTSDLLNTGHPFFLFTSAQSAVGYVAEVLPFQADSTLYSLTLFYPPVLSSSAIV